MKMQENLNTVNRFNLPQSKNNITQLTESATLAMAHKQKTI